MGLPVTCTVILILVLLTVLRKIVCTVFLDRISSFQRRSDASNILLLFNAQQHNDEQESSFAGLGYHLTPPANPPQGGHGGYYAIVSCPAVSNRSNSHDISMLTL